MNDNEEENEEDPLADRFANIYSHLVNEIDGYLRFRFDSLADASWHDMNRMLLDETREQTFALQELTKAVKRIAKAFE